MTIKIGKNDVFWGYAASVFNFGFGLILLPFTLRYLQSQELGVWYIFLAMGSFVSLLDFGFGPTIMRNVSYSLAGAKTIIKNGLLDQEIDGKPNYQMLNAIIKSSRKIYFFMALVAIIIVFFAGSLYLYDIIKLKEKINFVWYAWFSYATSIVINIYFSYLNPTLMGSGKIACVQKNIIRVRIVTIIISIIGLKLGFGLLAPAISSLVSSCLNAYLFYKDFYTIDMRKNLNQFETDKCDLFKIIWHNSSKSGLVSLGVFLIQQSGIILLGKYQKLEVVASFGITLQLYTFLRSIAGNLFTTYLPLFNQARVQNDEEKLKKYFSFSVVSGWLIYGLGWITILLFAQKTLNLIGTNTELLNLNHQLLLGMYIFLEFNHGHLFASFLQTKNVVPFVIPTLLTGIGIVLLSFILLEFVGIGLLSIIVANLVCQLAYNNWKWPMIVLMELDLSIGEFTKIGFAQIKDRILKK